MTITNPSQCGGLTQLPAAPSGYGVNPTWITCTTDSNGQVDMTYTAPNPATAYANVEINDCISVADETTSECAGYPPKYYNISFRTWYQFLEQYQFNLSPIARSGSLVDAQSVPMTFTAVGVDGTPQMNTQVWLEETGAQSGISTAGTSNTPLTSTFQAFMTDANGQIPLTYTAPLTPPSSGIDTIVAQSDTSTVPAVYNSTAYSYTSGYPTVSIGDVTTTEGDGPTVKTKGATALFELTLSAAQATPVTVQYFTYCGIGDKACSEDILEAKTPRRHHSGREDERADQADRLLVFRARAVHRVVLPAAHWSDWGGSVTQHRRGHPSRGQREDLGATPVYGRSWRRRVRRWDADGIRGGDSLLTTASAVGFH